MPEIPNTEPQSITAGETWAWTRTLPDYPATSWTLKYALQAAGKSLITLTATASGTDHAIAVAATTSVGYAAGVYLWTAYVEQGTTRTTVGRGTVTILPSPLAALGSTHNTRTLALLQAALEGRIPNGLESTDIDGQQISRIPIADLPRLITQYEQRVAAEENRAAIAAGLGNRRNHFARFTRVC